MKTIIKKSRIKGIYYLVNSFGSDRYLMIMHQPSETMIVGFTSAPVHRTTDIINESEKILSVVDWSVEEKDLTEKHGEVVKKLMNKVSFDEHLRRLVLNKDK